MWNFKQSKRKGSVAIRCRLFSGCFMVAVMFLFPVHAVEFTPVSEISDETLCSVSCDCLGPEYAIQADCSNRTLTAVPTDLKPGTVKL